MKSKLFYTQLFGILSLLVVLVIFVPRYLNEIPKKLKEDVQLSLKKNELNWVAVRSEGRDITLSGIAPSLKEHHNAVNLAEKVLGVRVVIDKISPTMIVPYSMNMEYKDNTFTLKGYMPSKQSQENFLQKVSREYSSFKIIKEVDIGVGEPKEWESLLLTLSSLFKELDLGVVNVVNNEVTFSGRTETTQQKKKILATLDTFKRKGFTIKSRIVARDEAGQVCQKKFDTLLASDKIEFKAGKSKVKSSSDVLLKGLVDIASLCPNAKIEIIGHTDSKGNNLKNQVLSQERAKAVVAKLFHFGVSLEQMEAIGKGELEPIASNDTDEGRAINRRIEFKVRGY